MDDRKNRYLHADLYWVALNLLQHTWMIENVDMFMKLKLHQVFLLKTIVFQKKKQKLKQLVSRYVASPSHQNSS